MENLTAFIRERSRRNEAERTALDLEQRVSRRAYFLWQEAGRPDERATEFWAKANEGENLGDPPAPDIAAVMTVIGRRSERNREREVANDWRLDLGGAVLNQANLGEVHLEGANLWGAHLEGAFLSRVHLERAVLWEAHLEGARLREVHLEGAYLHGEHLERADLGSAHLEGTELWDAHLDEGINLTSVHGDAATVLPAGVPRPAHWPAADYQPDSPGK